MTDIVTIDLDDPKQLRKLAMADALQRGPFDSREDSFAAWLRLYRDYNPTPEPAGVMAIIRDANGNRWIRLNNGELSPRWVGVDQDLSCYGFNYLPHPITVLSEGEASEA